MIEQQDGEFDGDHGRVVECLGGYRDFRGCYWILDQDRMTADAEPDAEVIGCCVDSIEELFGRKTLVSRLDVSRSDMLTRATNIIQSSAPSGVFMTFLEKILKATARWARNRHTVTEAMRLALRSSDAWSS